MRRGHSAIGAGQEANSRRSMPFGLTRRELEILELACDGLTNLEIARRCLISEGVVKLHLHHAYGKLGVQGRMQAARLVQAMDGVRATRMRRSETLDTLLAELLPHMAYEVRRAGEVLFRKDEPGRMMYYLQQGKIRFPELEASASPGALFGELGIFSPRHARTSSAVCETDAHLFCLSAEQSRALCLANPRFGYYMLRLVAERLWEERAKAG
ncbi:MAG: cyclic nucleotide-binding domain-containing protein [Burkholderiales bacterium]|nr:cyclic nucleotide-binding domain-containing protein [Burkholderiales bacterium]